MVRSFHTASMAPRGSIDVLITNPPCYLFNTSADVPTWWVFAQNSHCCIAAVHLTTFNMVMVYWDGEK